MLEVIEQHAYEKSRFHVYIWRERGGFETAAILDARKHLPANVLRPERNKRQHLSNVLSRNEVDRDYAYNRRLFMRITQGWYQSNPALAIRRRDVSGEQWIPIFEALNMSFVAESAHPRQWAHIDTLLERAKLAPMATPNLRRLKKHRPLPNPALGRPRRPRHQPCRGDQEKHAAPKSNACAGKSRRTPRAARQRTPRAVHTINRP